MMPGWYKGYGVVVSFVFCHFLCQISSSVRAAENGTRRRTRRAEGNIFTSFPQTVFTFVLSFLVVVAY